MQPSLPEEVEQEVVEGRSVCGVCARVCVCVCACVRACVHTD